MNGRKRALRVIAVLSVALAAGQVAETLRLPAQTPTPLAAQVVNASAAAGLPDVRGITSVAATTDSPDSARCTPSLDLAATTSAMIDLALRAPCNKGERVVIRHAGLSFAAQISPDGALRLQVPALEPEALVAAYFDGSQIALAKISVPDATDHIRFAVQMAYPAQFDLRAEEGGQVYVGSYGRTVDNPARRILPLGNSTVAQPLMAQVYSFPADDMTANLTVELKITPDTCGRTLPVETLLARGGKVTLTKLAVAVPLCGTSGDILLLKNLLSDLTLAAPR